MYDRRGLGRWDTYAMEFVLREYPGFWHGALLKVAECAGGERTSRSRPGPRTRGEKGTRTSEVKASLNPSCVQCFLIWRNTFVERCNSCFQHEKCFCYVLICLVCYYKAGLKRTVPFDETRSNNVFGTLTRRKCGEDAVSVRFFDMLRHQHIFHFVLFLCTFLWIRNVFFYMNVFVCCCGRPECSISKEYNNGLCLVMNTCPA